MATPPPFGVVLPSRPVFLEPQIISPTQFAFTFPARPAFSHIAVFLLPGTILPDGMLAGVYVQLPEAIPTFKLLGFIGNDRQSSIFEVQGGTTQQMPAISTGDVALGAYGGPSNPDTLATATVTVGISVEAAATLTQQLQMLDTSTTAALQGPVTAQNSHVGASPLPTKILAQRIIKNAFNFLASFAGSVGPGGQEVVPLKSFQDWWSKFERRIEAEPGFLEKEDD